MDPTRLSNHFSLSEFCQLSKYPDNIPTMQAVANMAYGCHLLLEPARREVGPIIVNSSAQGDSPPVHSRSAGTNRDIQGVSCWGRDCL